MIIGYHAHPLARSQTTFRDCLDHPLNSRSLDVRGVGVKNPLAADFSHFFTLPTQQADGFIDDRLSEHGWRLFR